jgi:hypothetical protein
MEERDMKRNLLLICLLLALAIGPGIMPAQAQNDPFVEGYVFLDANGDGEITAAEFQEFQSRRSTPGRAKTR